jgi:hypothetical protein
VRAGLALVVALAACGGEAPPRIDSAAARGTQPLAQAVTQRSDSGPAASAASVSASKPACASEGAWQPCSIEKRLTDAGFVPIAKGPAARGVFDAQGTQYALGPAELHVYIFPTAKDREAAVATIDTVTVTRSAGASPWSVEPTFITSNNLAAVLLSDNGRLIERVQLAITAGLPSAAP